jgi:lysozyme
MKASDKLLELLKVWEGSRSQAYQDVAGLFTIGVGHLLTEDELDSGILYIDEQEVEWHGGLTEDDIVALLAQDLIPRENVVTNLVEVPLEQRQFDTILSFVFNIGERAFKNSTLLRVINQGLFEQVPGQLMRWNKAAGRVVAGLNNRRRNEVSLWLGEI